MGTFCSSLLRIKQPAGTAYEQLASLPPTRRRAFIAALSGSALSVFLCVGAEAQDGSYGVGHGNWDKNFDSSLKKKWRQRFVLQPDGLSPDPKSNYWRPLRSKVDGEWVLVPVDTINNVVAPDGGAHVCAPRQEGRNKGVLFCVILPSEG